MKLEWNVYIEDVNRKIIKPFNIFTHHDFNREIESILKAKIPLADFKKKVQDTLLYYFWGKNEYEIMLTSWPPYITKEELIRLSREIKENLAKGHSNKVLNIKPCIEKRIDIYEQVMLNFNHFITYIRKEGRKENG